MAAVVAPPLVRSLRENGFARENFRGATVAFPPGIAIPVAALVIGSTDVHPMWTVALFLGPILILLPLDLREVGMLGDTGSNVIGAVAGLWLVLTLSVTAQAIALGVMVAIAVYGEFRSIAEVIDRTPGLRHLDSLGRITHA